MYRQVLRESEYFLVVEGSSPHHAKCTCNVGSCLVSLLSIARIASMKLDQGAMHVLRLPNADDSIHISCRVAVRYGGTDSNGLNPRSLGKSQGQLAYEVYEIDYYQYL